MKIVHPENTRR